MVAGLAGLPSASLGVVVGGQAFLLCIIAILVTASLSPGGWTIAFVMCFILSYLLRVTPVAPSAYMFCREYGLGRISPGSRNMAGAASSFTFSAWRLRWLDERFAELDSKLIAIVREILCQLETTAACTRQLRNVIAALDEYGDSD